MANHVRFEQEICSRAQKPPRLPSARSVASQGRSSRSVRDQAGARLPGEGGRVRRTRRGEP